MFALWYLSLAVDEVRKRLVGWTFFDFFKTNKTATNALDNKPAVVVVAAAPTPKPAPPVQEPAPASAPASAPAPSPASSVKAKDSDSAVPTPKPAPPAPEPAPSSASASTPSLAESVEAKDFEMIFVPQSPHPGTTAPMIGQSTHFNLPQVEAAALPPYPASKLPPTSAEFLPPAMPLSARNGNAGDALDRKLFEDTKSPFENGESPVKVNLKDATADFLDGESNDAKPIKRLQFAPERNTDTMVDAAVLTKLEEGFAKLAASDSKSLLKKYLTKAIFDNLKNKKTPTFGSTLLDCIQSGLENHDSGVGIYAPDAEAYTVFAEIFDPIIEDYHGGFKKTDKHPAAQFGDVSTFSNVDPTNEYVISTRVRCGRSMQGYPFNPCLTEAQYKEMEQKVSTTLSGLEGELKGKFYPLTGMEKTVQQQLIDDHFLFKEGDRFLQAANACRYWPSGRGIYHNDNKTFLVWCNEEDHLRIISMQMGGDLGEVYRRLVGAVNEIEKRVPFSHDDRLGFLTFCPSNLGTTIRASVHIKVPKLAANYAKLEEVAGKYNLQVRGTRGEHTEAEGGIYDISNKRRMGLTEYDAVKEMYDGITELIKLEKAA